MKRYIFLIMMVFCCTATALAQDLIVKINSQSIKAKVVEISSEAIRYKRFSNPDGPTYVLPTAEVLYIEYPNGERDEFSPTTAVPKIAETTPSAPTPTPTQTPNPQQEVTQGDVRYVAVKYEPGDLYDHNGVKGVVFQVDESGQHGLIISLDSEMLSWNKAKRKSDLRTTGIDNRKDGVANMAALERYIAENNLAWSDFPAFEWCRNQGEGWYLPSIDELLAFGRSFNGGSRVSYNRQSRNRFNTTIKEAGGKRIDGKIYYFSSSEFNERSAYTAHMGIEPPYIMEITKSEKFEVRAIRRF